MQSSQIISLLEERGYKVSFSEPRKLIENFDKTKTANLLWDYLIQHPSFRVIFNSIIKDGGTINLNESLRRLPEMIKQAQTSFVYEASCTKCKRILDRPNIIDFIAEKFSGEKEINCSDCKVKNVLRREDYKPNYSIEMEDLVKVVLLGCKKGIFSPTYSHWCFTCNKEYQKSRICPSCKAPLFISTGFYPILDETSKELINQQGYWLEWFIWRLIRDKFQCELGLKIKSGSCDLQCDLIILQDNKLILIECKDTRDDSFINKLGSIKKFADLFLLISTHNIKSATEDTLKSFLSRNKYKILRSYEIEKAVELIKLSNKKPRFFSL